MSDEWLFHFIEYLTVERNYSLRTVHTYRSVLGWFSRYLKRTNQTFSHQAVLNYIYWIRVERKNGARTVNKQIHTLRHFAKWAIKKGYITGNPLEEVYRLKVEHRFPTILSSEEVTRLMDAPVKYRMKRQGLMYDLICRLMCCTGMRKQEVINLNVGSFDFTNRTIRVDGKGRRQRIVPIPEPLVEPLLRYFNRYGSIFDGADDPAWVSSHGNRLSPTMIKVDLANRRTAARIAKPIYPHLLRHTFASHLATQDGVSFIKISQILGHSDPKITYEYYAQILPKDLIATMHALPWLKPSESARPEIAILSRDVNISTGQPGQELKSPHLHQKTASS